MKSIAEVSVDNTLRELQHEDWIAANAFSRQPEGGLSVVEAGTTELAPERNHPSGHELIHALNVDDWVAAAALSRQHERAFTVVDAVGKLSELPLPQARRVKKTVAAA